MSLSWLLHTLIGAFLLPPLGLLLLALLGLAVRRRGGTLLAVLSLLLLGVLSMPWAGNRLLAAWQTPYHAPQAGEADAIVVLGGGVYENAPEYGGDTVPPIVLERLRYAAYLHKKLHKPILVTGGAPSGGRPEAPIMKAVLERDFGVPVRWAEPGSADTQENARNSAKILKAAGIRRIFVVTQAWHMPRALAWFRLAGLDPVPAGVGFAGKGRITPAAFVPNGKGFAMSYVACHEAVGMFWYRLRQ